MTKCTKWRRNIAENFNCLCMAHGRYRETTDDRQTTDVPTTTYSERERKNRLPKCDHMASTKKYMYAILCSQDIL